AFTWLIGGITSVSASDESSSCTVLGGTCIDASGLDLNKNGFLTSSEVQGKSCSGGSFVFGKCGTNNKNSCCVPTKADTSKDD
ncbi:MAG TPA: hypothetical protein HA284_03055, partial [Nanoarchaeota archaeon]|nr:hypothetical protein [Nanoarchaeota archaeon]